MCNVVFYFVKTLFFLLRQRSVFRKGVARDGIMSVWQSVRGDSLIEHRHICAPELVIPLYNNHTDMTYIVKTSELAWF